MSRPPPSERRSQLNELNERDTQMIRLRPAARPESSVAPPEPIRLLDVRVARLLRDGTPRTAAQLAMALGAAGTAREVDAALARLAAGRRVLRAGYAAPTERGYGAPWPTLWGLAPSPR